MFKPGQFVVFKAPLTADEAGERFRVLEMRGERVAVQDADADAYWEASLLRPHAVYLAADIVDEVEAMIDRIKVEVVELVQAGTIPATCASFSELHNYCDANMLGGGENIDVNSLEWEDFCEQLNKAQNAIDAWIKEGGLHKRAILRHLSTTQDGATFWFKTEDKAKRFAAKCGGAYHGLKIVPNEVFPFPLK